MFLESGLPETMPYTFSLTEFSASLSLSALLMFSDESVYATGNIG
jgi:hypothetical protein